MCVYICICTHMYEWREGGRKRLLAFRSGVFPPLHGRNPSSAIDCLMNCVRFLGRRVEAVLIQIGYRKIYETEMVACTHSPSS